MPFYYQPHMVCYGSNTALILTMAFADMLIAVSYFGISSVVFYVLRNKHFTLRWLGLLFASFILCCGLGHLCHLMTIFYARAVFLWATALEFALTGFISAATFVISWMLVPDVRSVLHDFAGYRQAQLDQAHLAQEELKQAAVTDRTLLNLKSMNSMMDSALHRQQRNQART